MQQTKLSVKDMCCAEEVQSIERAIRRSTGVEEVRPNLLNRTVLVVHDPGLTSSEDLIQAVNQAGLKATVGEKRMKPALPQKTGTSGSRFSRGWRHRGTATSLD